MTTPTETLNAAAHALCRDILAAPDRYHSQVHDNVGGGTVLDLGVRARGGLDAGLRLAEICLAGRGHVRLIRSRPEFGGGPAVAVHTDHPVAACMASQYAGWQVTAGKYFAMGSGPMRAAIGREPLFDKIGHRERPDVAVGVLETGELPPPEVVVDLAAACGVEAKNLTLVVARTASQAGTVQIVARSIETSLHKMSELGFDLSRVESGWGTAPLPPVAKNDLAGIGRTNDAILYGGEVTLYVRGDDASIADVGPLVPSAASRDYGRPFVEVFESYNRQFYDIDPHLFSPAVITLVNLDTGTQRRYGHLRPDVIELSFSS